MGEITDYLGVDSSESNRAIESLDQKRFISRYSNKGSDFYKFKITEAGANKLPKLNEGESKLAEQYLTVREIELLKTIEKGEEEIKKFVDDNNLSSLKFSVMVSKLIKNDYLSESGLLKRKIALTSQGEEAIKKADKILA
jgi:SSS family solute:Na+ symporter